MPTLLPTFAAEAETQPSVLPNLPHVAQDLGKSASQAWHYEVLRIGETSVQANQIVLAVGIFIVGTWLAKRFTHMFAARMLARHTVSPNAIAAIEKIAFYLLLIIVTLTALQTVNIPITVFTVLGGAVAIGAGFGAQNIFNNFISGLILIFEADIRIGDMLEVEDWVGHVADIGGRRTRIKRVDGVDILVPNSTLLQNTVVNWTLSDNQARTSVVVGVAYGSPVKRVAELLHEAVVGHPKVLADPPSVVVFEDFGDSSLVFEVFFWAEVTAMMQLRSIRSDVRFRIDELFNENGIVIAFPQRDVHFDAAKPLTVRVVQDNAPAKT